MPHTAAAQRRILTGLPPFKPCYDSRAPRRDHCHPSGRCRASGKDANKRFLVRVTFFGCRCIEFIEKEIHTMPRGDKSSYTDKQKRMAEHIEEGYEKRGTSDKEAERRAWATVNKATGGGKKSGSGKRQSEDHSPMRKGGHKGGSSGSHSSRSEAAKRGWETRRKNRSKS